MADPTRSIRKSQLKRGEGASAAVEESYDPEIYDDTDFYQHQLRELIDSGGAEGISRLLFFDVCCDIVFLLHVAGHSSFVTYCCLRPADGLDPGQMTQRYLQMKKLQTKIRKAVDRRASKGRKIRYGGAFRFISAYLRWASYNVHEKLVSFMPPIETDTISQDIRQDLFSNLFGGGMVLV